MHISELDGQGDLHVVSTSCSPDVVLSLSLLSTKFSLSKSIIHFKKYWD